MGTNQSTAERDPLPPPHPHVASERALSTKPELISDNSFKALPSFTSMSGPSMSKAMTFDERRLLSGGRAAAEDPFFGKVGPNLKRAVTFVDKRQLERRNSFVLADVMFRRHFVEANKDAVALPPTFPSKFVGKPVVLDSQRDEAVVIVDTFSTGAMLAYLCYLKGYRVISLLSGDVADLMSMVPEGLDFSFSGVHSLKGQLTDDTAFGNLVAELQGLSWPIVAVMAGAETGVELADKLSMYLGLRTNGTALSEARRNKYVMGETVRKADVRAVKQLHTSTFGEIAAFLDVWQPNPYRVIVKPMDSAGSDDVTLCRSFDEVKDAFGHILGKVNGLGLVNDSVLVQEYLEGTEYVVDMVSRDGEHKLVGLWEYDRRPTNGAGFVLHGQRLRIMSDEPERYRQIVDYQRRVISALGIMNGPSHGEVKWCHGEPVLVEVGSRCHGGDGLWVDVAQECFGYQQAGVAVDVALGDAATFNAYPAELNTRRKYGALKFLISYLEGKLKRCNENFIKEIESLESYRGHQLFVKPGERLKKTQNCFTWGGCVQLVNEDEDQLERDYSRIAVLENGLFIVEAEEMVPAADYVAIVDPFSTGAMLAAEAFKRGFKVIAIYSGDMEKLGNLQHLVPEGLSLSFEAIVAFNEDINAMAAAIRNVDPNIVAILPGAETGVELADQLSSHFGLRTNGTALSEARRNKYVMGETVRSAGVRAVKQLHTAEWDVVAAFLHEWQPNPYRVIVKPMDSAGSDDVTLCRSFDEVCCHFHRILGKVNGLGLVNRSVLVQEYLEGTEYVIDMVSRDGEHKVVAVWEYDRRPVNGAGFVLHGQDLKIISDNDAMYTQMIEYQKKVCTALGIMNGPSHGEVKWVNGEPILVEVGSRCHGSEGLWIPVADAVMHCNQVAASAAAYLSREAFLEVPSLPVERFADGRLLFLVSRVQGILKAVDAVLVEEIRQMASFVRMELFVKPGARIVPTINCFTFGGVVVLINEHSPQLEKDYQRIHEMEESGLFEVE